MSETVEHTSLPISLENVTKRFTAGSKGPAAVDDLTMTIDAGGIVVLLGPSGCGKTTTMRLINRLIEPTSGRIMIGDQDARTQNPNDLRKHIGYVIQQAGLFPHMTVATNIGQVPQMLGWDKRRIAERVDELLELVGLEPDNFRGRYPRQLSGGQQQRIGVARALAADPPVLLMDEPFGAVDPITREHLQDELLSLQEGLSKTIVFVTHDVDEALKLGDKIAILRRGSTIAQYATPAEILSNPADEYVEQFIGAGASMRLLKFSRIADVQLGEVLEAKPDERAPEVAARLDESDFPYALVLDQGRRPAGWVSADALTGADAPVGELATPIDHTIPARANLQEALEELVQAENDVVPVVRRGRYVGVVSLNTVQQALHDLKERERNRRKERAA